MCFVLLESSPLQLAQYFNGIKTILKKLIVEYIFVNDEFLIFLQDKGTINWGWAKKEGKHISNCFPSLLTKPKDSV